MAKLQRRHKTEAIYTITGPAKKSRKFRLIGRAKIEGREVLLFRAARKASKDSL